MDERIEAFLRDVLHLEGETQAQVREGVRILIADCEAMFRAFEMDQHSKDVAARDCRALCRARVNMEKGRCKGKPTEAHLQLVLEVIDGLSHPAQGRAR
jgi:hypothetical protein